MTGKVIINCTEANRTETSEGIQIEQGIEISIDLKGVRMQEKASLLARFAQSLGIESPIEASVFCMEGYKIVKKGEIKSEG